MSTPPSELTLVLSSYIAEAHAGTLPDAVVAKAKLHILDTLAAMISGSAMTVGRRAIHYIRESRTVGEATVIGTRLLAGAADAALANGMMAHADETDDSHLYGRFHPGCGIVPAALAMAERQGASGMQLLQAVVLGYDVGARFNLSLGLDPARPARHSTHSLGTNFGAAAAAASLCRLSAQQVRYTLSYATQQASGVPFWQRDREHMEKAFDFGGMGARNGVTAAAMVASGFTATDDPLSGRDSFFTAFTDSPAPEALIDQLGTRFEIQRASLKKWSVGSPIQAALDALELLMRTHGLRADQVASLEVTLPADRFHIVDDRDMPDICVQHLLALMLVDGQVTFANSHDVARMKDPAILAMRGLIRAVPSPELSIATPARQAIVEVKTRRDETLRHHARTVRGTPEDPMTGPEVESKARGLIVPLLGDTRAEELIGQIANLHAMPHVSALRPLLQI